MRYLLDTNALSEPIRRRPSLAFMERFRRHEADVCTSVLCVGEMVYGARRVPHAATYERYLAEVVLPTIAALEVDVLVATTYAELRVGCERRGKPRADMDLLIAATALRHELTLVTRNVRHFAGLGSLVVEDWTAA